MRVLGVSLTLVAVRDDRKRDKLTIRLFALWCPFSKGVGDVHGSVPACSGLRYSRTRPGII